MATGHFFSSGGRGRKTETAGTPIVVHVPGKNGAYAHLIKLANTAAGTAHTLTVMRDASGTTLSANAASGQAVISVSSALTDGGGNAIASGDYVAVQLNDGSWHIATFSSAVGLNYTLAANLPVAANAGNKVYCYGVTGDPFHADYTFTLAASVQTVIPAGDVAGSVVKARSVSAPLILSINNATAASTLDYVMWAYSKK